MKFAGVDYDSHRVDIVLVDLDTHAAEWRRYPLTGPLLAGDAFDRARRVRLVMPTRSQWEDAGVAQVAIEDPKSRQFAAAVALGRVQGAILSTIPSGLHVLPLTPTQWKQALGLKPNSKTTKADVREYAIAAGAPADWPQDAHDAFCITHAAIRLGDRAAAA